MDLDLNVFNKLKSLARDIKGIIKINSNNDNRTINLTINVTANTTDKKLIDETRKTLKDIIDDSPKFLFSNEKTIESRKLIDGYLGDNSDNPSKIFIRTNIPISDKSIWYSALILRDEFNKGHNETVSRLKQQLTSSQMERGRNIANLCSAGYLETLIIPLYNAAKEKGDINVFYQIYETIVVGYPFAVFVSSNKPYQEIKDEVISKVKHVKSYGWKKVSVHGIGEENVKTIQKIAVEIREECPEITNTDIVSQGKIITVSITIE